MADPKEKAKFYLQRRVHQSFGLPPRVEESVMEVQAGDAKPTDLITTKKMPDDAKTYGWRPVQVVPAPDEEEKF